MSLTMDNLSELVSQIKANPSDFLQQNPHFKNDWQRHWPFPSFEPPKPKNKSSWEEESNTSTKDADTSSEEEDVMTRKTNQVPKANVIEPTALRPFHELTVEHGFPVLDNTRGEPSRSIMDYPLLDEDMGDTDEYPAGGGEGGDGFGATSFNGLNVSMKSAAEGNNVNTTTNPSSQVPPPAAPRNTQNTQSLTPSAKSVPSTTSISSHRSNSRSHTNRSNTVVSPAEYMKDVVGLLTMIANRSTSTTPYSLQHMNVGWLVPSAPSAPLKMPNMMRTLHNMKSDVLSSVREERCRSSPYHWNDDAKDVILINSPRSVLALMRSSVSLEYLQMRPQHDFTSPAEAAKYEAQRRRLYQKACEEYDRICQAISLEQVVDFCRSYDIRRPYSALAVQSLNTDTDSFFECTSMNAQRRLQVLMNATERRTTESNTKLAQVLQKEHRTSSVLKNRRTYLQGKVDALRKIAEERKERQDKFHSVETYVSFQRQTHVYNKHEKVQELVQARNHATSSKGVIARVLSANVTRASDQYNKDLQRRNKTLMLDALKVVSFV
eukprot:PhF_6_TR4832/c0_g1_i1/m.6713